MAKKLSITKKEIDPWLDEMPEDSRVSLKDYIGKTIEIDKGFVYNSKAYGQGFTFRFKVVGETKQVYTTSFGAAIVRQADEQIVDALKEDSVIVKVGKGHSKTFNTDYVAFEEAD